MTPYVVTIAALLVVMFVASFSASREMCDISFATIVNALVTFCSGVALILGFLAFTVIGMDKVFG